MKDRLTFKHLTVMVCSTLLLVWVFAAGLTGSVDLGSQAYAQTNGEVPGKTLGNQSDSDFWRKLRRGQPFELSGTATGTPVLIQSPGEEWRSLRNGPLSYWGGLLILASLVFVVLFFALHGKIKMSGGRSGRAVPRFSQPERWIHWFVASLFILLGLSGLFVMFGRYVILPIIGKEAWSPVASASLQAHNLLGPIFVVALVIMLAVYFKDNIWQKGDLVWALKGGFFSKDHPPSWKYNLGEKFWYWLLFFAGLAISGSGLLLDFPWLAERVQQLQLAHLIHGGAAVVLIATSLAHIYLGTIGVEGALEGMTQGYVDENWAKEHHGWWAEEAMAKGDEVVEGAGQSIQPDKMPAE
ncbi:MAG: formate dehydrogenase subunit gamma [Rhodospirillales bacterium]|nr:formate dehydrogenase subunit gamma [Rhodospirillales bacterium]